MTIEQAVLQNLQRLPAAQKQEVLDFVEFLQAKMTSKHPRRNPIGLFATLGVDVSETDIAQARQELWGNFPRDSAL
jgi:hypothetical protein